MINKIEKIMKALKREIQKELKEYSRYMGFSKDCNTQKALKSLSKYLEEIHNRIARKWSSNTSLSFTEAREQFALLVEKSEDWDHWKLNEDGYVCSKNVITSRSVEQFGKITEKEIEKLRQKYNCKIEIGGTAHLSIVYKVEKIE